MALLLLDLDDFKEVNDALGHHAGDRLLVAFAERLRRELRECDTIARLGGDEFALLLTTNADVEGAAKVAERVLEVIDEPFDVEGLALQARTSIGIAVFPDHAEDAESLSARADVAMYLAKGAGKGAAVYSPELDRSSIRRLSLLGHLRDAIADDQLSLQLPAVLRPPLGRGGLASRRSCAGSTPSTARSAPTSSSAWPRCPASSSRSRGASSPRRVEVLDRTSTSR